MHTYSAVLHRERTREGEGRSNHAREGNLPEGYGHCPSWLHGLTQSPTAGWGASPVVSQMIVIDRQCGYIFSN